MASGRFCTRAPLVGKSTSGRAGRRSQRSWLDQGRRELALPSSEGSPDNPSGRDPAGGSLRRRSQITNTPAQLSAQESSQCHSVLVANLLGHSVDVVMAGLQQVHCVLHPQILEESKR